MRTVIKRDGVYRCSVCGDPSPDQSAPHRGRCGCYATRTPPLPTLRQRAASFATAAAQHVAAGMPLADQAEIDRRFAVCQQCEHYDGTACSQCGCPVVRERNWRSKLSWAEQSCPVGKWGPVAT